VSHELRVLGPWELRGRHGDIRVPAGRLRVLLTSLALSANQTVTVDMLAEHVWPDRLPARARGSLHTYVGRLRKLIGSELILTQPGGGYRLTLAPEAVDLHRFRYLLGQAREAANAERELRLLREALTLWRGTPFAELYSTWLDRDVMPRLTEEWLAATVRRLELELAAGPAAALVAELRELTSRYPTREALWHLLISTLHLAGRRAEALEAYQRIHTALREELGIEPGERLVALQRDVLRDGEKQPVTPPRQLPHDLAHFTGRDTELATLEALGRHDHVPTIVVLDGPPGVGKTTLALHWAHRAAARYPDGQLHLDLRGHGPDEPVSPMAAVDNALRSLGVRGDQIPGQLAERSALLRSTLSGRRALLLLDNAANAEQVRPLLPGGAGLVIVTSRDQLRGLSIKDGAHRVTVRPLTRTDSVRLLAGTVGADRVVAESAAAGALAALCDRLPLALSIVAERAARAGSLTEIVAGLAAEETRLDTLGPNMRTALSWSYLALRTDAAALLRRLARHGAGDFHLTTAATLIDAPAYEVQTVLDQLVAANLVERARPDHYRLSDLIRLYAKEMPDN
jgi:DNA-binding SARP family transcriptional activator